MRVVVALAFLVLGTIPQALAQDLPTTRELKAQLRSDDWTQRRSALVQLAPSLGLADRPAVFGPLLDDPHPQVRETAIELLYGTQDTTLVEPLLARCLDADAAVREAAVGTLCRFDDERVVRAVAQRMGDDEAMVRRRAIAYFQDHDCATGRQALETALHDVDAVNRMRAVTALAQFATSEVDTELADLVLNDPDPRVRCEAGRAFLSIESQEGLLAMAQALSSEPDASVRSTFVFALQSRTHQEFGEDSQAWLGWLTDNAR